MRLLCPVLVCFAAAAGGCKAKKPAAPAVIDGWGEVVDPAGDCAAAESGGTLRVTVPAGLHDLNPLSGPPTAPRVVGSITGEFTVVVRVTSDFEPGARSNAPQTAAYVGAGLVVWSDAGTHARFERNKFVNGAGQSGSIGPRLDVFAGGQDRTTQAAGPPWPPGRSVWLRLTRRGPLFEPAFSTDGRAWQPVPPSSPELPGTVRVGVAAVNTSDRAFTAEFDQFSVTRGP